MELILASASPRREELLKKITDDFIIVPAQIDEAVPDFIPALQYAEFLAVQKARAVALQNPDAVVIGCDTAVIADGVVLGKPKNKEQATEMIQCLSGKEHQVITGCALFYGEKSISFSEETKVRFYSLTESEISDYVQTDEPYDKAGGYGIQGAGALLISGINGDYYNVVGLPVAKLSRVLQSFTKEIL